MRGLRAALAVCALAAAPVALAAQQTTQQTQATNVRPIPPVTRPNPARPAHPHPVPSGASAYRNHGRNGNSSTSGYPVVIDGSVINRFLATPSPKPKHYKASAARTPYGEQVFETHSTDDGR